MIKKKVERLNWIGRVKFSQKPVNSKIIKFKNKSNHLTDEDIKCLFVGLVNLIKSNVYTQYEDMYRLKINRYQDIIDKNNVKLKLLKNEIKQLKEKSQ